jgi:malate synthase
MLHPKLKHFIEKEILPLTEIDATQLWEDTDLLINEFSAGTLTLLSQRHDLQRKIDLWHQTHRNFNEKDYKEFLESIGYLEAEGEDFNICTENVDEEIAALAGPQLVVPLKNARFAINAANARWGSLYDALYGSDIIVDDEGRTMASGYSRFRGEKVISYARTFLDSSLPLLLGSHADVVQYLIDDGFTAIMSSGLKTSLKNPAQFAGYQGSRHDPSSVLLKNNGLHVQLIIDRNSEVGSSDRAGIKDIHLEAALTTIMDCEDSVAAVDVDDKINVYRNWLGLMTGTLSARFTKKEKKITRSINDDPSFLDPEDNEFKVPGKSLLFNRNVGLLMTSEMATDSAGMDAPEHIIDAFLTALISSIDLNKPGGYSNSKTGSIYIVKPKMHGPTEVKFTCELFSRIESMLHFKPYTIKLGIMDEERRTSLNLKECIRAAKMRLVFINTGFLDRTGDEIFTSMHAGAFPEKEKIKDYEWIKSYENRNVEIGLSCGLPGRAQIGKGMWAMPDEMAAMMREKIKHPQAGASTAWVPSPTAAVLHAIHYHLVDVKKSQQQILDKNKSKLESLLKIPLKQRAEHPDEKLIKHELEKNLQSVLGYVVRWVEHGVGCSKVPDINNIGLMEDRATLRISAVHIANWLAHGLTNQEQVIETMQRMARVVDLQNSNDPFYTPMAENIDTSYGFAAAKALIFQNQTLPNGYTEPILHAYRVKHKNRTAKRLA